jgi:hypothetical protein
MKNPIVNISVTAAMVSIIGKMLYFIFLAPNETFDTYTRFFYLLCFLIALFIGLRNWKLQNANVAFTDDVKSGMKIVSIYAIILSSFTFVYYKYINPNYFLQKIQSAIDAVSASGSSNDELNQVENTASFVFNAFTHSTLTLFGLMVIGFFYTLILILLFRYKPKAFGL